MTLRVSTLRLSARMDYQDTLTRIHTALKPIIGEGKVASYIPELANVAPDQFGMPMMGFSVVWMRSRVSW